MAMEEEVVAIERMYTAVMIELKRSCAASPN